LEARGEKDTASSVVVSAHNLVWMQQLVTIKKRGGCERVSTVVL